MEREFKDNLIKLIAYDIPVDNFVKELAANDQIWKENTWRQDYIVEGERPISPQKDTQAAMFRWAPKNTIESVRDSLEVINTINWIEFKEIRLLVNYCANIVDAQEIGRVFIAKLLPGGSVLAHSDYGLYSDHFERFHLVLTSKQGNEFFVQDTLGNEESVFMEASEFYWFNHKENHWAVNNSNESRMHLIIDMVAPSYRRERASV